MAWAAVSGGSGTSTPATPASVASTLAPVLASTDVFVMAFATDNTAVADGVSANHFHVWDDSVGGNTYHKLGEYTIAGGGAGLGVTVSLWAMSTNVALAATNIIYSSFAATTRYAYSFEKFTKGLSYFTRPGVDYKVDSGADAGAITLSGLAAAEHLFLRATGHEGPSTDAYTATASYTSRKTGTNMGGAADADISVALEWRILNATTDTSNPTWTAVDHASIMAALDESSTSSPTLYVGANNPVLTVQIDIEA